MKGPNESLRYFFAHFTVDCALLPTESLAFGKAVLGRFNRTSATPTQPLPCLAQKPDQIDAASLVRLYPAMAEEPHG
jgi:hypothetical protein